MAENTQQDGNFINLSDLAIILYRRKILWLSCFIVIMLATLVYGFVVRKPQYTYQQSISLPYAFSGSSQTSIVPLTTLIGQVNNELLPQLKYQLSQQTSSKAVDFSQLTIAPVALMLDPKTGLPLTDPTTGLPIGSSSFIMSISFRHRKDTDSLKTFQFISKAISQYLSNSIKPYIGAFKLSIKNQNEILQSEIPALENLRKVQNKANDLLTSEQPSASSSNALQDLYITSVGAQRQSDQLYQLKTKLKINQQKLSTLTSISMGKITVLPAVKTNSWLKLLIVGIFMALFFSFIMVFVVEFIAKIKKEIAESE